LLEPELDSRAHPNAKREHTMRNIHISDQHEHPDPADDATISQPRNAADLSETASAVVAVRGLTKRYGAVVAVQGVTFALEPGTITGFLGPNGAGKTTTLRMLLGLVRPTGGDALVFGRRYQDHEHPARRIGAVLESGDFDPGRSGRNHLRTLALAIGVPNGRVEELLELVELQAAANRLVKTYSLGMRQRLGLAGALLGDPELLLLDEPANGLDPAGVHWLRGFLRQFAADGRTVLISSHVLAEVAQTVDQVVIIDSGCLIATVQLDELRDGARSLEEIYLELTAKDTR
jgi:ABC-2 type transport system ATP-binding protein